MTDIQKARLKRQAQQSRSEAVKSLLELSESYRQAAQELKAGTLTRGPLDLLAESIDKLRALDLSLIHI